LLLLHALTLFTFLQGHKKNQQYHCEACCHLSGNWCKLVKVEND
jgi:hypothetical protein